MLKNDNYEMGQDNIKFMGLDVHNPVFAISSALILLFILITLVFPDFSKDTLSGAKAGAIEHFDWLFIWGGNLFVLLCLFLLVSPYGKIRIGGKEATTDYSNISWFAMLFAAGMGIGLMFWSVAEPVAYYTGWWKTPFNVMPYTEEAANLALGATMYHWGFHPWAMYGIVGLALAFFSYNHKLPLSIRSTLYPILGEKTWGWPGHVVDVLAVIATLFGLATSLGFGAQQAASGIGFVFGIDSGTSLQVIIVIVVTALAIFSVMRGLDRGVKVLSNVNMALAGLLLLFVVIMTVAVFGKSWWTTVSSYISNIIPLSNPHGREDTAWFQGWTVFYWAWWISWSPFVGMFIARISKGRTIRQFLAAVLLVPTFVTSIWMAAFGGNAVDQAINKVGALKDGITEVPLAMFQMFESLPMTTVLSLLAIILVLVFFVTSSDSGSLVIDSITAGGKVDAPAQQRVFWATAEGAIAAVLLFIGGSQALSSLQAGAISTGLPFIIIMLLMGVSLLMGLSKAGEE